MPPDEIRGSQLTSKIFLLIAENKQKFKKGKRSKQFAAFCLLIQKLSMHFTVLGGKGNVLILKTTGGKTLKTKEQYLDGNNYKDTKP